MSELSNAIKTVKMAEKNLKHWTDRYNKAVKKGDSAERVKQLRDFKLQWEDAVTDGWKDVAKIEARLKREK